MRARAFRPFMLPGIAVLMLSAVTVSGCSNTPSPWVRLVRVFYTSGGNVLAPGQQLQLSAEARYSDDHTEDVTNQATWRSQNENVATVSGGLVTGVTAGGANILATFKGASGATSIQVRTSAAQ